MADLPPASRRDLVLGGIVGAALGTTVVAAGVSRGQAKDRAVEERAIQGATGADGAPAVHLGQQVRWRLASSFPATLDTMFGTAQILADEVAAMSGGRFIITPFQAGELVGALQVLDAVQQGSVELGQTAAYYYTGKNPALSFETCVPFGLDARQQSAWLEEGGGNEAMAPVFADFGVRALPAGNTGCQMGGWFRRVIESAADLRGLKMRIPGLGGKVMDQLGVAVQVLGGNEIFPALERGAIDATEWVGPYDDLKLGFHKVAPNYYYPGWWEPGPHLAFYVAEAKWQALPKEYQHMLATASRRAAQAMITRYDARNPAALQRLVAEGAKVRPFSEDLMQRAREAAQQLLSDEAAKDPAYRRVYEQWSKFRADSFAWAGRNELAYASFAMRQ
jgi:TRAP-type mannitol/chloroaromatic compound transport system substrate-binding protein